ncbi:phosphotransferase [Tessaracoccus defluvii]|uniref:phosphotransferase n=1 Tax=Tessaracoccus defluvii TaxID=1285901 RepID=UPI001D05A87D|nr:phosphotransferase [Tessaracoccus defluvii]
MRLLRDRGIDLPEPLGFDAQGRSVTEFVPGPLAMDSPALSPGQLRTVGAMVRAIHDASVGIDGDDLGLGPALIPIPAPDLVCHGDLTPWNLVLGERWVFIDWDGAAASSRVWDLAYSVQAFTLNDAGADPAEAAAHLGAFIDGYGADQALRDALLDTLPDGHGPCTTCSRPRIARGESRGGPCSSRGTGITGEESPGMWRGTRRCGRRLSGSRAPRSRMSGRDPRPSHRGVTLMRSDPLSAWTFSVGPSRRRPRAADRSTRPSW